MTWGFIGGAAVTAIAGGISADRQASAARGAATEQTRGIELGIEETRRASAEGLGFLTPFAELGQTGVEQAGFLTDPQAQFDFLQNNPLFQMSLKQAGTETKQLAAARGRISAGDTLQQLSENVLLSAQPLIQQQKGSIQDLINLGSGTARSQANVAIGAGSSVADLLTSAGDVSAAGIVGAGRARAAGEKEFGEFLGTAATRLINRPTAGGQT